MEIIIDQEIGRLRGFELMAFKNEQSIRDTIKGMNKQTVDGTTTRPNTEAAVAGSTTTEVTKRVVTEVEALEEERMTVQERRAVIR